MKLLLDTPALIWWLSDDDRTGRPARALIANPGNDVLVSVVSLREIVVKVRVGKLEADSREIAGACDRSGFISICVRPDHLMVAGDAANAPPRSVRSFADGASHDRGRCFCDG